MWRLCVGRLMATYPDILPLAGFAALMLTAALVDFRRLVIPNGLVAALCVLWFLRIESTRGMPSFAALESIAAAALALVVGAVLFARGLLGGGDVKLFAAASLWTGASALPQLLLLTASFGGALALLYLSPLGPLLVAAQRVEPNLREGQTRAVGRPSIPYGVAIAGAALIVALAPYLA